MLTLLATALLSTTPASDRLAPESDLSELRLFKLLLTEPQREVQMVSMPATGANEAVFIAKHTVYSVRATTDGKRDIARAPLGKSTYELLKRVWASALLDVGEPLNTDDGAAGTLYHFADWSPREGYRAGQVWTPPDKSRMQALINLGDTLTAFARATPEKRSALEAELKTKADKLLPNLKPD